MSISYLDNIFGQHSNNLSAFTSITSKILSCARGQGCPASRPKAHLACLGDLLHGRRKVIVLLGFDWPNDLLKQTIPHATKIQFKSSSKYKMKSLIILKSAQTLNACNLYTFILFPGLSKSTLFKADNGLHRKSAQWAHPSYRKTQLYVPTKRAFWVR